MSLVIDTNRGSEVAALMYEAFRATGIHGHTEMPEDLLPDGIEEGLLSIFFS